jgi:peroxiredoxin
MAAHGGILQRETTTSRRSPDGSYMYGKKVRGIERSTFVIDADGKLVKEWRGVKVPGHAEEVLDFVKTL